MSDNLNQNQTNNHQQSQSETIIQKIISSEIDYSSYNLLNKYTFSNIFSFNQDNHFVPKTIKESNNLKDSLNNIIFEAYEILEREKKAFLDEVININQTSEIIQKLKLIENWMNEIGISQYDMEKLQFVSDLLKNSHEKQGDDAKSKVNEYIYNEIEPLIKKRLIEKLLVENEELEKRLASLDEELVRVSNKVEE